MEQKNSQEQFVDKAEETKDLLQELVEIARKAAEEKIIELSSQGEASAEALKSDIERKVREQPGTSILLAGGIGLLLGLLLSRK